MDLKYTWSEFCLLETYFKTKMADLVLDDHGHHLNVSQIYINNFDENCPPKNNVDKASPKFYIIKPGGAYDEINKNATIKAYETLRYLTDNNLGTLAGPLFQRKVSYYSYCFNIRKNEKKKTALSVIYPLTNPSVMSREDWKSL